MKELPRVLLPLILLIFQVNGTTTSLGTTVDCADLKHDESLEDMALTASCSLLNSSDGFVLSPANIPLLRNDKLWSSFVRQLEEIYVNVKMDQSAATEFHIEHLEQIDNDEVIITNNPNLESISINQDSNSPMVIKKLIIRGNPSLTRIEIKTMGADFIGSIEISGNDELLDVDMDFIEIRDDPPASYGEIYIAQNPKLNFIYMKKLKAITVTKDIVIDQNEGLHEVNWPVLEQIHTRADFLIANNQHLKHFKFPAMQEMYVEGTLAIYDNLELIKLEFPKMTHLTAEKGIDIVRNGFVRIAFNRVKEFDVSRVTISRNNDLTQISMAIKLLSSSDLSLSGNRLLSSDFLKRLENLKMTRNKKKKYLQVPGECWFTQEVKSLMEMKGCTKVISNLILKFEKPETIKGHIKEIYGNVDLGEMRGDFDFLNGTTIGGYITSAHCGFKSLHGKDVRSCYAKPQCPSCSTCKMWLIIVSIVCAVLAVILIAWCAYVECFKNSRRSFLKRVPGETPAATPRTVTPINKENFDVEDYY